MSKKNEAMHVEDIFVFIRASDGQLRQVALTDAEMVQVGLRIKELHKGVIKLLKERIELKRTDTHIN